MREISANRITETVSRLCQQANYFLPEDVWQSIERAFQKEKTENGREVLAQILENARISTQRSMALCQDTGITEIFLKVGQDVHITGGSLVDAVNKGVSQGYKAGYLRNSIVKDPLNRINTGDNTPAQIYAESVAGDKLEITILPKGGGTENSSVLKMFLPSDSWQEISQFILEIVKTKGINACPPLIVGVGVGGSFSSVALLAKKALLRHIGSSSNNSAYAERESELLREINKLAIGPMGLGGAITALAVNIEFAPCHIASLPVAVSMQCHSLRRRTEII